MSESIRCYSCGKTVNVLLPLSVRETCSHCATDLHCCLMCTNYAEHAHNECKEPLAEEVRDKEKANYCDYFSLNTNATVATKAVKENALEALDDLFKK